ncbi:MAG: helix-turn-helix domain-containing protein [Ruminococcus sp.]|nr:helix-turn-helix domain-containing protein [Ruminococcus sp.]
MSTVFRVEKSSNYTVMSNFHMMDYTLSYKAKGILSEILSLPPTWDYTLAGLAALANDGIDSVRSGIKELENSGYCYIPF